MGPRRSGHGRLGKPGISTNPGLAQEQGGPHPSVSKHQTKSNYSTVETSNEDTTASIKHATMILAEKVVVIEERTVFLGDLIKIRRGTREVERYVRKQEELRHESKENMTRDDVEEMMVRERDIVMTISVRGLGLGRGGSYTS